MFRRMNSVIVSGICIERNLHQLRSKRIFPYFFTQSDSGSCLMLQEESKQQSFSPKSGVRLWLDRKLMWREMARWQTFTINSLLHCMVGIGAVSKNWAPHKNSKFCQTVLPSGAACSHLVVSIHLHSLIITEQVSPFFTLLPFFSHYSFGQEGAFTTQLVWPPKKWGWVQSFAGTLYSYSPWVSTGLRKWEGEEEGRERACVIHRETQTRESESCVEAHQRRKKPDLLSPKINCRCQLTDSPSAANYRHSRKDPLSPRVYLSMHTYTHSDFELQYTYLCVCICFHKHAHLPAHTLKSNKIINCCQRWNWRPVPPGLFPADLSELMPMMDNEDVHKKTLVVWCQQ